MLKILEESRNLQTAIKEAEQVLTEFNLEKMPSFELGEAEGRAEAIIETALALIKKGSLPDEDIAEVTA